MSLSTRQAVNEILREHGASEDIDIPSYLPTAEDFVGEEHEDSLIEISHEGGEYRDLATAFEEMITPVKYAYTISLTQFTRLTTKQSNKATIYNCWSP